MLRALYYKKDPVVIIIMQILLDFLRKKLAKLLVLLIRMGFNADWDLDSASPHAVRNQIRV
jgi:hypothetical protein